METNTQSAEGSAEPEPDSQHLPVIDTATGEPFHFRPLPGSLSTTALPEQRTYQQERAPRHDAVGRVALHEVPAA